MRLLKDEELDLVNGTSFWQDTFEATINQIEEMLGEPTYFTNDGTDKVNVEWNAQTSSGLPFTIYDWKEYRPIGRTETIRWHVGGHSPLETDEALMEILELLASIEG
jgi:hypothetical protein